MTQKKVYGCSVSIEYSQQGSWATYFGEGDTETEAINEAKRKFQKNNPGSRILQSVPDCSSYYVDVPDPNDVIEEISASRINLKFRRLRNGFLKYSIGGGAWRDSLWPTDGGSRVMEIKDMAFSDDAPSDGDGLSIGGALPLIPLIVIGGDDTLIFKYLNLTTGLNDLNKQMREFQFVGNGTTWDYFGWPDPGDRRREIMKAQSIKSLTWNSNLLLKVTVVGGDGKTCITQMNTQFSLGGSGIFASGWSCS